MNPSDVGSGLVSGGEPFVWAAYIVSWIVLVGYTVGLWIRTPRGGAR